METINFYIQGNHEAHNGSATIVENYNKGCQLMTDYFTGDFETNKIGIQQDGVRDGSDRYAIYENYQDSGSDDYFYFAVKIDE